MAFEKILNTRIALKIDTLENWLKSTLPLKKGELALATVAASAGTGLTEPVIMIKVGEDGVKTFKDLEWNVYAKAADVLSACKDEASLKTFINGVIADAGIATNEAMEALAGRVTTAEGKITTLEGNITTLNGEGEGSVTKKIADAIAALKLGETYEVKGEAAKVQGELNSYKESNDIALANVKATAEAAYVKPVTGIAKSDLEAGVQASLGKADTALQSHQDISHLAVKSEVETELGKKVDKTVYEGKVGELETAIGKKVEKVEGKSLVLDTEITKLAGVSEGANKVEGSTVNGKIKIDGVETVVYTHPANHTISEVTGLQDALDGKQAAGNYSVEGHKHEIGDVNGLQDALDGKQVAGDYATKTEAQGYADAKDEAIAEAKKAGTDAQAEVDALELYVGTFTASEGVDTVVKYIDAKTANIASDERVSGIENRVKAIEDDYLVEADKTELSGLITAEKERAEGIEGGLRTDVDAIKGDYLKGADKTELEGKITAEENRAKGVEESLQTQINTIMNNPDAEGAINSINEFTQYVKDHGEIAEGFRTDINKNKEDIAAINNAETGILKQAKDYADGLAGNYAEAEHDHVVADITDFETVVEARITAKGYATTGYADQAEAGAKTYADGLNTAMDTRVKVLEGINHDAYKGADETVLQSAKDYADGLADNYAAAEHTHTKSEITDFAHTHEIGEVNGLQGKLDLKANDADLKAVAKSGLIDDLSIGEGTVLVFDCGDSNI